MALQLSLIVVAIVAVTVAGYDLRREMTYTFRRDPGAPAFVSKAYPLFSKLDLNNVRKTPHPKGGYYQTTSMDTETHANSVQTSLGLRGRYGAFTATLDASFSHVHHTSRHTMKSIRSFSFSKYYMVTTELDLWNTIPEKMQKYLLHETPFNVYRNIGEFVPKWTMYGGVFKSIYSREVSQNEDKTAVATDLEANYFTSGIRSSASVNTNTNKYGEKTFFKMQCFGGNPLALAGKGDVKTVQNNWAKTVTDDVLWPSRLGLMYLWEVLPSQYQARKLELQTYFQQQWKSEASAVQPATAWAMRDCDRNAKWYWCDAYSRRRRRNRSGWSINARYCPDGCRQGGRPIHGEWCNDHGGFWVCNNPGSLATTFDVENFSRGSEEELPEPLALPGVHASDGSNGSEEELAGVNASAGSSGSEEELPEPLALAGVKASDAIAPTDFAPSAAQEKGAEWPLHPAAVGVCLCALACAFAAFAAFAKSRKVRRPELLNGSTAQGHTKGMVEMTGQDQSVS